MKTGQSLLYFVAAIFCLPAAGQISLRNPLICHDKDNYLRCYNDGTYLLTFAEGNFKTFKTADSRISYSDPDKTLTFLGGRVAEPSATDPNAGLNDTIQLQLLPQSIVLKKKGSALEITSMTAIPPEIGGYHVTTYSSASSERIRGFSCWAGDKFVEIEVWDYGKNWYWNIYISHLSQKFGLIYSVAKDRLMMIAIRDDALRYGMAISMTFKSFKKVSRLESVYIDHSDTSNNSQLFRRLPLDKNYRYDYTKTGKLKQHGIEGELKLCDCN